MFYSLNNKLNAKGLLAIFILASCIMHAQSEYVRFVDSAQNHIEDSAKKALQFIDSVPKPIENHIEGRLADYYAVKALIHDDFNECSEEYKSNILALKYAEIEENYEVAGLSCLEIFSILYHIKKDSIAYTYLEKARAFYELSGYENGLVEVKQAKEYIKYMDSDYEGCNALIHENIDTYKNIENDGYYYLFALYMLTDNYLKLNDFEKAHFYFNEFKGLENNKTIAAFNYKSFKASLLVTFAEVFFKRNRNDSTMHYLTLASESRGFMGEDEVKEYFKLNANISKRLGKIDKSLAYLDSLRVYEDKMFSDMVDSSFQINEALLKTETQLKEESEKKYFFGFFGVTVFVALLILSGAYFLYYRKQKMKLNNLDLENRNLSHLKSTHEKLTVKVQGLEDYIASLRNKVKIISNVNDVVVQKEMIKEFYKNIHLGSSTITDESNNHLDLVNDFNIKFFNKLKELYPELTDSEIIICYHIYIGFKNKEMALFLNTTIRAVESRRYRITKKLGFNKSDLTLSQFLKDIFEDQ